MNPVLPHKIDQIIRKDGIASQSMRAWMESVQSHFLPDRKIEITKEAEFPVQDATTITLKSGYWYQLRKPIVTAKRFIVEDGVFLTGFGTFALALTYTGSDVMFTAESAKWDVRLFGMACPNGTLIECTGAGITIFQDCAIFDVKNLGSLTGTGTDFTNFNWNNVLIVNVSGQGFVFNNDIQVLSSTKIFCVSTSASFRMFDISNAVITTGEFRDNEPRGVTGSVFLYALANSANIKYKNILTIESCGLGESNMLPLGGGIAVSDVRVEASDNGGLRDTIADALIYFRNNAVDTTFSAPDTPTKIEATWSVDRLSKFLHTPNGRLVSLSEKEIVFPLDVTLYAKATTGTPVDVTVYLYINGAIDPIASAKRSINNTTATEFSIPWQPEFNEAHYVEFWAENNTNSNAVLFADGTVRIK